MSLQGGPFVLVRVSGGCLSSPCPGSLGPLQISADYLAHDQYQQALLLLNQLDWKSQGQTLIISITNVFHKILRLPVQFTPDKEALLEMCLGLFHAPTKPIPDEVREQSISLRTKPIIYFSLNLNGTAYGNKKYDANKGTLEFA